MDGQQLGEALSGDESTPESSMALAYDPAVGKILAFGGFQGSPPVVSNQTWTWNGTTWTRLSPSTVPPARAGAAMAYDVTTAQLVMYGGANNAGNFSDTWIWSGSNWLARNATTPGPLSNMSISSTPRPSSFSSLPATET